MSSPAEITAGSSATTYALVGILLLHLGAPSGERQRRPSHLAMTDTDTCLTALLISTHGQQPIFTHLEFTSRTRNSNATAVSPVPWLPLPDAWRLAVANRPRQIIHKESSLLLLLMLTICALPLSFPHLPHARAPATAPGRALLAVSGEFHPTRPNPLTSFHPTLKPTKPSTRVLRL